VPLNIRRLSTCSIVATIAATIAAMLHRRRVIAPVSATAPRRVAGIDTIAARVTGIAAVA